MSDYSLVIAKYREDVSWLHMVDAPAVVVYDKYPVKPIPGLPSTVRVRRIRNIGRDAETYLRYITQYYFSLSKVTYFLQGNPFVHSADLLARIGHDYKEPTTLTTHYRYGVPEPAVRTFDYVTDSFGFECRYGLANNHTKTLECGMTMAEAVKIPWGMIFDCPMPDKLYFGYANMYAVPKHCIKDRPLRFWRWLHHQILSQDGGVSFNDPRHPLNAWMFELIMWYLYQDPAIYPNRDLSHSATK